MDNDNTADGHLTEARMLELARQAGFIITTSAEAEVLYQLGRAFEKEILEQIAARQARQSGDAS